MSDAAVQRSRGSEVASPIMEHGGLIWRGWSEKETIEGLAGQWEGSCVTGRFLAAMRAGNYQNAAAQWAGISPETMQRWLRTGREHMPDDMDALDLREIDPEFRPYVWLVQEYYRAEAHGEVELVTLWKNAAKEDWRAARDLLARRHKERWMDRTGSEISGPGGGPIPMVAVTDAEVARQIAEDPEARKLASELLARVVGESPESQGDVDDIKRTE